MLKDGASLEEPNLIDPIEAARIGADKAALSIIESGLDINHQLFYIEETGFSGRYIDILMYYDNFRLFEKLLPYFDFGHYLRMHVDSPINEYENLFLLSMFCHWVIKNDREDILYNLQELMDLSIGGAQQQHLLSDVDPNNIIYNHIEYNLAINNLLNKFSAVLTNNRSSRFYQLKSTLESMKLNITISLLPSRAEGFYSISEIMAADKIDAHKFKANIAEDKIKYKYLTTGIYALLCATFLTCLSVEVYNNNMKNKQNSVHVPLNLTATMSTFSFALAMQFVCGIVWALDLHCGRKMTYKLAFNAYTDLLLADIVKTKRPAGVFFSTSSRTQQTKDIELNTFPSARLSV